MQYILDLHPSKCIVCNYNLFINIQNFNFDNIQNVIDLDCEQLINSSIGQSKKKILRNNIISNNTQCNDNISVQSNRNVNRKQRCLVFAKTQQMYTKNRSMYPAGVLNLFSTVKIL